jgi:hypothetical protein
MLVVVASMAAGSPPAMSVGSLPPGGTFIDDNGSVHEGAVEALAAAGVTRGCNPPTNNLFCPDAPVTRAQMAAFLHRALPDLEISGPAAIDFADDDGSIFEGDIRWLASVGVTRGCNPPDNTEFCPDQAVTRDQMAAFLVRALGYSDVAGSNTFTDDDGSVFEDDIERLAAAGVALGCNPPGNTQFCPLAAVTRAQMASFLTRALDYPIPTVPDPVTPLQVPGVGVCEQSAFVDLLEGIPWADIYGPGLFNLGPYGRVFVYGYHAASSSVDLEWQAFGGEPTVTGYDSEYGEVVYRDGEFAAWKLRALEFPPVGPADTVIDESFGSASIEDLYFAGSASAPAIEFRIYYDEPVFHLGECTSTTVIGD